MKQNRKIKSQQRNGYKEEINRKYTSSNMVAIPCQKSQWIGSKENVQKRKNRNYPIWTKRKWTRNIEPQGFVCLKKKKEKI